MFQIIREKIDDVINPCNIKNRWHNDYFCYKDSYFQMTLQCRYPKECPVEWDVKVHKTEIVLERSNTPKHPNDLVLPLSKVTKRDKGKINTRWLIFDTNIYF